MDRETFAKEMTQVLDLALDKIGQEHFLVSFTREYLKWMERQALKD